MRAFSMAMGEYTSVTTANEQIDSEVHGAGSHAEGSDEDAEQLQESRG